MASDSGTGSGGTMPVKIPMWLKMKSWAAVPALFLALTPAGAGYEHDAGRRFSPAVEQFTYSWVAMPLLPRRFQNHCGFYYGHYICADHCGFEYQVYFCSKAATGCCHVGHGWCDDAGDLRCSPSLF
jgi:hypothetical protein